jgi:hypothetical protein
MDEFSILLMFLALVLNALWYWIKIILKKRGYQVNWFWGHFRDIFNIFHLASKTENKSEKTKFYLLGASIPAGIIVFATIFFSMTSSQISGLECELYQQLLEKEWSGVVVDKYLDSKNHRSKTIVLKSRNTIETITDFAVDRNYNYEKISFGDSLIKNKGTDTVLLYTHGQLITLHIDSYRCNQ